MDKILSMTQIILSKKLTNESKFIMLNLIDCKFNVVCQEDDSIITDLEEFENMINNTIYFSNSEGLLLDDISADYDKFDIECILGVQIMTNDIIIPIRSGINNSPRYVIKATKEKGIPYMIPYEKLIDMDISDLSDQLFENLSRNVNKRYEDVISGHDNAVKFIVAKDLSYRPMMNLIEGCKNEEFDI